MQTRLSPQMADRAMGELGTLASQIQAISSIHRGWEPICLPLKPMTDGPIGWVASLLGGGLPAFLGRVCVKIFWQH